MKVPSLVLLLLIGACPASVHSSDATKPLTEAACIERALQNDASVAVLRIDRAIDSLSLESARAAWLPSVTLDATGALSNDDTLDGDLSLGASQVVPGGGTLDGSVSTTLSRSVGGDPASARHAYSLSLRQPLARGAWAYSSPAYDIRIQRLDERTSRASFIADLSSELSQVRRLYWNLYEQQRLLTIAEDALEHARRLLTVERARFQIGEAAAIDTLRASLEVLKAEQSLLNERNATAKARHDLAEALSVAPEELSLPDSLPVEVHELGSADELTARIRQFDPQRKIFSVAAEKLREQLRFARRELLPQVDLVASYSHMSGALSSASVPDNAVYSVVLSYAIPTRGKRIDVQQARLSLERSRIEARAYELELRNYVTELIDAWHNDRRSLDIAAMSHDVAQQYLEAARKGYEVGTVDRIEYLEARDEAVAEAVRLVQRRVLLKQAEIVFDELTGETLSRCGVIVE